MIPHAFLDELRSRLSVSEVVGRRVKLRKAGREWKGLRGRRAPLAGDVRGFAATCIPMADIVAAVSRCCTALVGHSPAGTATAWPMRASRKRCVTVG
jgi:hypothetical protein